MMKKHLFFTLLLFQLICCQQFFAQTYILNEDFNSLISNIPSGWDNDDYTCSASSRWASYNDGYNGTRCLRFNVFSSAVGLYSVLKTPILNLSNNCVLRFKYKNYQSGDLQVFISLDAGVTYTTPISGILTTDSVDEWREMTIPLSAYVGQSNVRIIFYGISNYGSYNQYLDDVIVETLPICMTPPNVYISNTSTTSIEISVLDSNYANWELAYKVNETASSDTIVSISNSRTYTVNGLTPDTEYTYRVRRRCNDTTTSEWSSYDSIRTLTLSPDPSPLCFTARNGSVTVEFYDRYNNHSIQYSIDSTTWNTYPYRAPVTINENQSIYFRSSCNHTTATAYGGSDLYYSSRILFSTSDGGFIEGSGNIMSLYGPDCPDLPLQPYAFAFLFYDDTLLTSAPELPATSLGEYCYHSMFGGCEFLTTPPYSLPATSLANHCYDGMFSGCSSMVTAPVLPATTMAEYCYFGMFSGCSSVVTAPVLPATTMEEYCYRGMFYACTSLVIPPELPALTLAEGCYNTMFYQCESLVTLPILPATTLTDHCYKEMFHLCTSLQVDVARPGQKWMIPATSTATNSLINMLYVRGAGSSSPSPNTTYYILSAPKSKVSAGVNDTTIGSVNGTGLYYYGDTATLTPIPVQHYHFARWSDGDTTNPRYVYVTCDSAFSAIFEPNKYNVSSNNYLVSGTGEYNFGSTVTLIAHSAEHERFVQWADGTTDSVHSFVLSSGDTTIIAFYALDSFNITASCDKGTVSGVGVYAYKDIASIYVEPDKGYRFVEWNDGNGYNPRVFAVEEDLTLEAICEEAPETGFDEAVDETPLFYIVGNTIYNPANELLRVFSASGKLLQQADNNIELTGYPAGVYVVVNEKGHSMKVVTR